MMQPAKQEGVYEVLKFKQGKFKHFYDRSAQKKEAKFQEGGMVDTKMGNEKVWEPDVAKHSEPRSYLVRKDSRGRIVRHNISHLRPSHFKGTGRTVYQSKRTLK
ncbi:hypothetical protein PR048_005926 [Dryococelus australis]|uniref:HNH endonuclease n=1 Tax=Dryococelus australis TaxID=614101 RepID=A0ABQ9IAQ8_9NEOP|nr:hypothetical protein PR048_005926 [Dryococelus australis]